MMISGQCVFKANLRDISIYLVFILFQLHHGQSSTLHLISQIFLVFLSFFVKEVISA